MSTAQWMEAVHDFAMPGADCVAPRPDFSLPLPLPKAQADTLRRIAQQMNAGCVSAQVGMIAVFTGCDAAGKLMAAEALAYETQHPLCRIDRSDIAASGGPGFGRVLAVAMSENAALMIENADDLPASLLRKLKDHPGLSILVEDSSEKISAALGTRTHCVDFSFPFEAE